MISEDPDVTGSVPKGLRVCAALAWRFLVVIAALYVVVEIVGYLSVVVIPVSIALLLAALLAPAVRRLVAVRVPRSLATALVLVGGLGLVGGLLTFVIIQFTDGLPALQRQLTESLNQIEDWLINGPLHLRETQIEDAINSAIGMIQENQAALTSSALTTASTVGEFLTGFLLTLFVLIFFLVGGDQIWGFLMRGVPAHVRDRADTAGRRGFASLVSYVRATAAVAVVDAVGIGIGLWIVGVPLVIPLSTLVFLGAFIPIIGAVVTGAVAVLVALVTNGFVTALVVLAIVIGVMQLESHVLQPLLLGRAVKLHPLAVILAITVGLVAAGIPGALLSVPLLAVLNSGIKSLLHESSPDPESVDVLADKEAKVNADDETEAEVAEREQEKQ
ncbi:AI-2E family transporter [Prauserella sp. PE36]|uniref:AI-2E family transporter n=1 Tax=Prauserella endophytica TaxID=1592324 RepID=A0ABY2SFA6_9PSEU|nr:MULTISPECIES: AI-2E family transporter [Prauserella]RBM23786.1 AI-2E family transporter [Prauserella sp. PE36]TKG73754.1 AI-2E family transporter [Prauserella endophytica]